MHLTQQLFNAEEAFVRVGQMQQTGCLVIISPEGVVRLFVEKGAVVAAMGEQIEGQKALDSALGLPDASHRWIPDAKPPKKTMEINIAAYVLKHSVARDIRVAETSKVPLANRTMTEELPTLKVEKKVLKYYHLIAEDRPNEKLPIGKGTVILGRDESCDIILNHIQVSRRHCLIQILPRGLSFRDLGSTNGIAVNGFEAQEGFLSPGDKIQLGSYTLRIHCNS